MFVSFTISNRPLTDVRTVSLLTINTPPHLRRVATLPCEMFVLKNRNDPELSEANFHARLSHSKQLLKNIHPMTLALFLHASAVYAVVVCLSVYLSVISRCSTETSKRRITQTTRYDSPDSSFLMPKILSKLKQGHPNGGAKCRWGRLKWRLSTSNSL